MKLTEQLPILERSRHQKRLRFIYYYPVFSELFGSQQAAIVFCSLGQWQGYGKDPNGTIYKSHRESAKETGLTLNRFNSAKRRLEKLGVITCAYTNHIPRTTKYSIHWDVVNQILEKHLAGDVKKTILIAEKSDDKIVENQDTTQYIQHTQQHTQQHIHQHHACDDDSKALNELMGLFKKSINPTLDYSNKTQRNAATVIIQTLGSAETAHEAAAYAISIQGNKFAPVITTPLELKNKMGQLLAYKKRQEPSSNNLIANI